MTEQNQDENETPHGQPASEEESEPGAPVPAGRARPGAAVIARGEEASAMFPGQVRAALEYAAENQYEYGPGLHGVELTWDVVSAETMRSDIVRVRLEYSPTTSFRGDPGTEYLDVDPDGAILARRQVRVPRENRPLVLMGITAFSVLLAVVFISFSLMGAFTPEGDPLYIAARTLYIRAERPEAQQYILYTGADMSGKTGTWALKPDNAEDNELVYITVTLINQTSGTVSLVIDERAATLLDGGRTSYKPIDTIQLAFTGDVEQRYNVDGFIRMWGSLEIKKDQEATGMLVFELPKGSTYTELRWKVPDPATIRYR